MPGAYAHLTMVNLMRESARLARLGFSDEAAAAVLDYLGHCELGAVSPDYPYLAIADGDAGRWADLMHYERTGEVIRSGLRGVSGLAAEPKRRAFAWLLGYASHVATDVTIHPVVELRVGPYAENKRAHRVCEMHQDAHIFQRMNLGEIGLAEHLRSGVLRCVEPGSPGVVDGAVKAVWEGMLRGTHVEEAQRNPPRIDQWHRAFDVMVNRIGEEGNHLLPIARHVAVNCGLTYPLASEVDAQYIVNVAAPGGLRLHYDQIFDRAMQSVGRVWSAIERAVFGNEPAQASIFGNWNLDTGRDETGRLVFWT